MPAVVDPQGRVADLSQCPLKRSRPVRRGRAATGAGAEQEIVWTEAVLVDPGLKQVDELTRDRKAAGAGLGLAGLIERHIGRGDVRSEERRVGKEWVSAG